MRNILFLIIVINILCLKIVAQNIEVEDNSYYFLANNKIIDTNQLVTFRNSFFIKDDKKIIPVTIFIKVTGNILTKEGHQLYRNPINPEVYISTDNKGVYVKNNKIIKGTGSIFFEKYIESSIHDTVSCFFNDYFIENKKELAHKLYEFSYFLSSFNEQPLNSSQDSIIVRLIEPIYSRNSSSIYGVSGVVRFNLTRINYNGDDVNITIKKSDSLSIDKLYTLKTGLNYIKKKSKFRHLFRYIEWQTFNHPSLTYNPDESYNYHNVYPSLIEFKVGGSYYYYFIRNMQDLKDWSRKEVMGINYILSKLRKELKNLN